MKKLKQVIIVVTMSIFTTLPLYNFGQSSSDNNTPVVGKYLGYDGPQNLDFKTNDILRMQLMQTQTSTINGFPGIAQDGFVGLSDELNFFNPGGTGPYSMLHLNGDNDGSTPQQFGWRPWMRYGMTVTSNRDLMYVGHLNRGRTDQTDAVISWSDNTFGPSGPDNLRFIYTSGDGTAPAGDEDSFYGLEAGRFSGLGRFGCGDFSPSGADEQPTHQLDVNGQARVRDVPVGPGNVLMTGRQMSGVGDYELRHLAFPNDDGVVLAGDGTWVEANDLGCEWNEVANGPNDDLAMGYGGACNTGRVGIGVSNPGISRLRVYQGTPSGTANNGTLSTSVGAAAIINGVFGQAFTIANGDPGEFHNVIGTAGVASSNHCFHEVIGIYGEANAEESCSGSWAGYFEGSVLVTGGVTELSDESIKQNVENIEGGLEIINQLEPKTYEFIPDVHEGLILSNGQQYGLIAQELEEVLPALVKDVNHLAQYDSLGNMTAAPVSLKGVNYNALIPILIAGMKEQQSIIESQNEALAQVMDQMENLQQQINNCCSADGALPKNFGIGDDGSETGSVFGKNELHQNSPNPFRSQTTISYTLEQGGKVLLSIFDKTGKPITTLVEAEQAAGTYRYEWDASGLPAGLYHYALYVDGDLLVKKAIKLQD